MRGRRITLLVVIGLVAAGSGASYAQAMPIDLTGPEVRGLQMAKINAVHAKAQASVRYARRHPRG
jgi:hypothetical protein